jgi:hypothetical protein
MRRPRGSPRWQTSLKAPICSAQEPISPPKTFYNQSIPEYFPHPIVNSQSWQVSWKACQNSSRFLGKNIPGKLTDFGTLITGNYFLINETMALVAAASHSEIALRG